MMTPITSDDVTRVAVLNVVGLSTSLIGSHTPRISGFIERTNLQCFPPAFPAVTCTAQASMLTGKPVQQHGIVANGWYDRESAEWRFWKQSNHLVKGDKIWDVLKKVVPNFTCAKLFWWYNMHASVDFSITPRPLYFSDGQKFFDIHTQPMSWRDELKRKLGPFPFPAFWGPAAGIGSSKWIAESAKVTELEHSPTLSLVYLPHLDYCLQKFGPDHKSIPAELEAIDNIVGDLLDFYEIRGIKPLIVSEYGISAVQLPIHLNRLFRENNWLSIKNELGTETLDAGGSQVFAIADHQVAHIYAKPDHVHAVKKFLEQVPGIESVALATDLWGDQTVAVERAGDLVVTAAEGYWFTYFYWENDALAPEFARCVDIHRKPGYDPCELHLDPEIRFPKLKIAWFLFKKKCGLRAKLELIPLDANVVKGSHGRCNVADSEQPVCIGAPIPIHGAEDVFQAICHLIG